MFSKFEERRDKFDLRVPLLGWFDVDFFFLLGHYLIFRKSKDTLVIDGYLNPILELTCLAQCLLPLREYFREQANLTLLRGRLLSPGEGYASVRFEALIARTLKENGHEVDVRAFRGREDFDILSTSGKTSVEIECKTQSAESGQRVKMNDLFCLVDGITSTVSESNERLVIFVGCSDRLHKSDLDILSEIISRRITGREFPKHTLLLDGHREYEIQISQIGLPTDPLDPKELSKIIQSRQFDNPPRVAFFGKMLPQGSVADPRHAIPQPPSYILSWSKKKNRPLTNLRKHLLEAAHQLSGKRPSIVCLHLDTHISWPEMMKIDNVNKALASALHEQPKVSALLLSALDNSEENQLKGSCMARPILFPNEDANIPLPENYHFFKDAQKWCRN